MRPAVLERPLRMELRAPAIPLLALALGAAVLAGVSAGAVSVSPTEVLRALVSGETSEGPAAILVSLRLPRVALAAVIGAVLGISGAAMQALFRNPLVDPGLLGTSSGAALGAVGAIVLGAGLALPAWTGTLLVPVAAFGGALLATLLALRLGGAAARVDGVLLLLAGIAINALSGAAVGLLTHVATDAQLRAVTFWSLGSLGGASWKVLATAAAPSLLTLLLLLGMARPLNAMLLGEREAFHLGLDTGRIRRRVVLAAALGVGAGVSTAGIIGFVGLLSPSLTRLWLGPDLRALLPASALFGATLLVLADLLARTLTAPAEIPVGILTSALGAPVFVMLLARRRTAA